MKLIDSHTHLYLEEFRDDQDEVIDRALKEGVSRLFLPNIDSSTITGMRKMQIDYPGICYAMMGLHPTSVNGNYREELKTVKKWLDEESFIAVGEIGIDLYWDKTYQHEQEDAFEQQLIYALDYDLPVVIHSRESFREIFAILDRVWSRGMKGVFHSFTGSMEEVEHIKEYDFYFGINGIVTFKNSGLDKVVEKIPPDRIILETDSPYLAPVPKRGRRNESSFVRFVAEKLAEILNVGIDEIAELTTGNAMRLFNLHE